MLRVRSTPPFVVALPMMLLALSCSSNPSSPPDEVEIDPSKLDCAKITVPSYSVVESGIFTFCVHCHSSTLTGPARNGAPDNVNFDTYEAAKLAASGAVPMVEGRYMPYPDGAGPTNAERNRLYEWALCGTPP